MSDSQPHRCKDGFYCRTCGEMYCEECSCSCFACECPCHGDDVVTHD